MAIKTDPDNNEVRALFDLVDFSGKHVLEIGCGDGRLTWRYAEAAAHVTGIDTFEQAIGRAKAHQPDMLRDQGESGSVVAHRPLPQRCTRQTDDMRMTIFDGVSVFQ